MKTLPQEALMRSWHRIHKDRVGWLIIAALALLIALSLTRTVRSHSWYDADCCSDHDCEPVSAVSFVASDPKSVPVMVVTTSFGTKPVTSETRIRESHDSRMHACIFRSKLICLYLPVSD